jgi:hypothetical protein
MRLRDQGSLPALLSARAASARTDSTPTRTGHRRERREARSARPQAGPRASTSEARTAPWSTPSPPSSESDSPVDQSTATLPVRRSASRSPGSRALLIAETPPSAVVPSEWPRNLRFCGPDPGKLQLRRGRLLPNRWVNPTGGIGRKSPVVAGKSGCCWNKTGGVDRLPKANRAGHPVGADPAINAIRRDEWPTRSPPPEAAWPLTAARWSHSGCARRGIRAKPRYGRADRCPSPLATSPCRAASRHSACANR